MSCKVDKELLERYIDGEVDALERVVMDNHIKACPECAQSYGELEWLSTSMLHMGRSIECPRELIELAATMPGLLVSERSTLQTLIKVAENSTRFVHFMPGLSTATSLTRKGVRVAPKVAWGVTSYLVRGGAKLAQVFV